MPRVVYFKAREVGFPWKQRKKQKKKKEMMLLLMIMIDKTVRDPQPGWPLKINLCRNDNDNRVVDPVTLWGVIKEIIHRKLISQTAYFRKIGL